MSVCVHMCIREREGVWWWRGGAALWIVIIDSDVAVIWGV